MMPGGVSTVPVTRGMPPTGPAAGGAAPGRVRAQPRPLCIGMAIARRRLDQEGVAAIMDVPAPAIALAAADLAQAFRPLSEGGCALLKS